MKLKRKLICGSLGALAFVASVPVAVAVDQYDYAAMVQRGDLGTVSEVPAVQRTVRINNSTKYINVERYETLKIENDTGQSFVWRFDTLGEKNFPLKVIAPSNFLAGVTRVFVRTPYMYMNE